MATPRADDSAGALSRLPPEKAARLAQLLRKRGSARDLHAFVGWVTPHHPALPHMQPIIDLVAAARRARWGHPIRACVSMPPRHGKSETLFNGLAWWMADMPGDMHAYLTFNDETATSQSRKIRQRAQDGGVHLSQEMANLREWRTTSGGGLYASGVGRAITGRGITGLAVVDDPFADREDADSKRKRDNVWEWFTSVVMTRLEHASVMVVHTRWHEDDLIGRLAAGQDPRFRWDIINLPAIAGPEDPLGRQPGEALWPEERPLSMLEEHRSLDAFNFEALYQGQPRPRGARVFGPPHYHEPNFELTGYRITLTADPAASEKTTANYSAALALATKGYGAAMEGRVLNVYHRQVTIPELVRDLMTFSAAHGNAEIAVEAVGGFKAIPQMLREIDPAIRVREIRPLGDKFQRAQPAASAWNAGRLTVPRSAPWLKAFLAEVCSFTGVHDAADDQVDVLAHAWNEADQQVVFTAPNRPILPRRR